MYKIETHLHTAFISHCGWLGSTPLVKAYREAGYSAIAVTDHYNRECFEYAGIDLATPGNKTEAFLEGYYRMKKEAERYGLIIYEGAELRFDENNNDYLIYGFSRELLGNPDEVIKMGIAEFSKLSKADGAVIVQAHPFRKKCIPALPEYIDGIEVRNLNPRHENRNYLALEYAQKHGLLMTGGSDCHRPGDEGTSGILCETLPKDTFEFAEMLRTGSYTLLGEDK